MASSLIAHGGATAAASTNACFAQDELHEDADLSEKSAGTDASSQQQQQPDHECTPPDSPARTAELTTLYAFLSEMEQLDDDDDASSTTEDETSRSPAQKPDSTAPSSLALDPLDPLAVQATAVGASVTKPRKKKLSTYARTLREKAALKLEIAHMEHTVRHIKREHHKRFAHRHAKRWGPIIQHELQQIELLEAERFKLRRRVGDQQQTRQEALDLIDKMRSFLQASSAAFERVAFQPQLECEKDNSIFQMLAQVLASKGQAPDHVLAAKLKASEMSLGKVSADSAVAEYQFVYMLPFDIPTASQVTWRGVESAFGLVNTGLNKIYAAGTQAIKQEHRVSLSDRLVVKMTIQAIVKQVVSGDRSILTWEGLIQWRTPTDKLITAAHESGSIAIEPLADSDGVSVVKGFVRLTPVNTYDAWLHVARNMTRIVLPSYQKVMDGRQQYVENYLIDTASACSVAI